MPLQNDIENNSSEFNYFVYKMSHVQKDMICMYIVIRCNFLYDSALLELAFFPFYLKPVHRLKLHAKHFHT